MAKKTTTDLAADLKGGRTPEQLVADGATGEEVVAAVRYSMEAANRVSQGKLAAVGAMKAGEFAARFAWMTDGQALHGELRDYVWNAELAGRSGNQAEMGRQLDLLFKAARTFTGGPPA